MDAKENSDKTLARLTTVLSADNLRYISPPIHTSALPLDCTGDGSRTSTGRLDLLNRWHAESVHTTWVNINRIFGRLALPRASQAPKGSSVNSQGGQDDYSSKISWPAGTFHLPRPMARFAFDTR